MKARAWVRRIVVQLHLWLGLTIGALWALQGLTGALLVFHREAEAALGPAAADGPRESLDRIAAVAPAGSTIERLGWRDATRRTFLVEYRMGAEERIAVAGAADGRRLADYPAEPRLPGGGASGRWLYRLHETLLLGDRGETLIGISGLLLLSTALGGAWLGWPRRGQWRAVAAPGRWRSLPQRLYGWHRLTGLGVAAGLLLTVPTGAWMVFASDLRPWLARHAGFRLPAKVSATPAQTRAIGPERAWQIAHARFPAAALVRVSYPTAAQPAYTVRLWQPGETRAWLGTTAVTIGAADGRVLDSYDALRAPLANRIADAAYAVHTGEVGGWGSRLSVLLLGLALPTLYATGVLAWLRKRRRRAP